MFGMELHMIWYLNPFPFLKSVLKKWGERKRWALWKWRLFFPYLLWCVYNKNSSRLGGLRYPLISKGGDWLSVAIFSQLSINRCSSRVFSTIHRWGPSWREISSSHHKLKNWPKWKQTSAACNEIKLSLKRSSIMNHSWFCNLSRWALTYLWYFILFNCIHFSIDRISFFLILIKWDRDVHMKRCCLICFMTRETLEKVDY